MSGAGAARIVGSVASLVAAVAWVAQNLGGFQTLPIPLLLGALAASYLSLKQKSARPAAAAAPPPRSTLPHKKLGPLSPNRDNSKCTPRATCTECIAQAGCAWCKNLNECVAELGTTQTCSVAGRQKQGLFQPLSHDHVASTVGERNFAEDVGKGSCGAIINPTNGLYHVHPDQTIVLRSVVPTPPRATCMCVSLLPIRLVQRLITCPSCSLPCPPAPANTAVTTFGRGRQPTAT